MPVQPLPAPGAKAAKVCGILAIILALTCVGIPVAVVLGIVALVQHAKARRLARTEPEVYAPVPATGLVTGIIGLVLPLLLLPLVGIVSAIAIPALLTQRTRAREAVLEVNFEQVRQKTERLGQELQAKAPGDVPDLEAVLVREVLADPQMAALRNPFNPASPALQAAHSGGPGVICLFPGKDEEGGLIHCSVKLHAAFPSRDGERALDAEVPTRTVLSSAAPTVPPAP